MFAQMCGVNSSVPACFGFGAAGELAGGAFLWLLFFFVPVALAAYVVQHCFSGPLRIQERARIFLDLMEAGFRQGQRPEAALAQAAQTNDRSLGKLFQELAARLREGVPLSQALDEVPKLLPPQVAALIRVGEEMGDVRKVLPVCRGTLKDAESQTRNGFNYLVIANLIILPTMPILILIMNIVIFPKFKELFYVYQFNELLDVYHETAPAVTMLFLGGSGEIAGGLLPLVVGWLLCQRAARLRMGAGGRPEIPAPSFLENAAVEFPRSPAGAVARPDSLRVALAAPPSATGFLRHAFPVAGRRDAGTRRHHPGRRSDRQLCFRAARTARVGRPQSRADAPDGLAAV
jgi:hypothetical protein